MDSELAQEVVGTRSHVAAFHRAMLSCRVARSPLPKLRPVTKRALPVVCILALLAAFAIDLVTPQLFVAAILLDVPIVLSTYARSRRLTGSLIAAALVANIVAGYVNGCRPDTCGNRSASPTGSSRRSRS